jgi:hypothetical protein
VVGLALPPLEGEVEVAFAGALASAGVVELVEVVGPVGVVEPVGAVEPAGAVGLAGGVESAGVGVSGDGAASGLPDAVVPGAVPRAAISSLPPSPSAASSS